MYKVFLSICLASTLALASENAPKRHCTLAQEGAMTIQWKAYKTPEKIGVGGIFDKVSYKAVQKEGQNFRQILVGSSIDIDTKSVNSKNKGRDAKLVKFFFQNMTSENITAKIIDIQATSKVTGKPKTGKLITQITMNGITKKVPLHYIFDQGTLKANGTIDLFDFSANKALQAINKACFAKHQGKTWNDVSIGFSTHIKAVCDPIK